MENEQKNPLVKTGAEESVSTESQGKAVWLSYEDTANENLHLSVQEEGAVFFSLHDVASIEQHTTTLSSGRKVKQIEVTTSDGKRCYISLFKEGQNGN